MEWDEKWRDKGWESWNEEEQEEREELKEERNETNGQLTFKIKVIYRILLRSS